MIMQRQISLQSWIPKLCSKPFWQIQWVARGEYQVSLASHSPVWFITFMTLAEAFAAAELFLTLPKYCKTWLSPVFEQTGLGNQSKWRKTFDLLWYSIYSSCNSTCLEYHMSIFPTLLKYFRRMYFKKFQSFHSCRPTKQNPGYCIFLTRVPFNWLTVLVHELCCS